MSDLEAAREQGRREGCFSYLNFVKLMNLVGGLALAGLGAIIVWMLSDVGGDTFKRIDSAALVVLLGMNVATAVVALLALLEVRFLTAHMPLLQSWVVIGYLMCYLSCIMIVSGTNINNNNALSTALDVCTYSLFIVGLLFVVLGLVGGKRVAIRDELRIT